MLLSIPQFHLPNLFSASENVAVLIELEAGFFEQAVGNGGEQGVEHFFLVQGLVAGIIGLEGFDDFFRAGGTAVGEEFEDGVVQRHHGLALLLLAEEFQRIGGDGENAGDHEDGGHPGHERHVPAFEAEDEAQPDPAEEGAPEGEGAVAGHAEGRAAHGVALVCYRLLKKCNGYSRHRL